MKQTIDKHFAGDWLPFYEKYLPELKHHKGKEFKSLCLFHQEKHPSLFINSETGQFNCFGCETQGSAFTFYSKKHGLNGDFKEICKAICDDFGISCEGSEIAATYDYENENGELISQTVRTTGKKFWQRQPNGKGGWINNLKGIRTVLYNLKAVIKATEIIIVEGEKDADNLNGLGFAATTNPMGAGKWRGHYNEYLKGKHIVILPDNDKPGREHAEQVAKSLESIAASIKIIELDGLPEKGDVSDWLRQFNDDADAAESLSIIIENAAPYQKAPTGPKVQIIGYSAAELMRTAFPEPRWAIPGILPEGLNLLAGKPKHGKSIMALNWGIAISSGSRALGAIEVDNGTVIYLALEDTHRRLKKRLAQMLTYDGDPSDKLRLYTAWPRMFQGGINQLESEIQKYPDTRLIMIDTLPKFRPPKPKSIRDYDFDYEIGAKLKEFADTYQVPVLVICHLRKTESEDRMDDISGTFGVTGSADGILALVRKTGQADAELHVTGRDVEAAEYALKFDNVTLSWNLIGNAHEVKNTEQQQTVYDCIKDYGYPMTPKEIAERTGLGIKYIKNTLPKLIQGGSIIKAGYGQYIHIENTDDSSDCDDS